MQDKSNDVALTLQRTGSSASLWMQTAASVAEVRLLALSSAARETARRQSDRTSRFALRLTARAKSKTDALMCAARSKKLSPLDWRKFAVMASSGMDGVDMEAGSTKSEAEGTSI
jgi:hypothetical protein